MAGLLRKKNFFWSSKKNPLVSGRNTKKYFFCGFPIAYILFFIVNHLRQFRNMFRHANFLFRIVFGDTYLFVFVLYKKIG